MQRINVVPTSDEANALQMAQAHNSYAFQPLPYFTYGETAHLVLMRRAYLAGFYRYQGQPS